MTKILLPLGFAFILAAHANAVELKVRDEASVFAIVTHKAGIAKGKAHNHFVAAGACAARINAEPGGVEGASFEIELAADDLVIDDPDLQKTWYPRLAALGILNEPFGEVSDKDRAKIRESALGDSQLDAARFPKITARLTGMAAKASTVGEEELGYEATLAFEVHGRSATRPVAASVAWEGDVLRVEAVGTFQFSDFGIKPFSAFFGAVKNTDEFHVYVSFEAR